MHWRESEAKFFTKLCTLQSPLFPRLQKLNWAVRFLPYDITPLFGPSLRDIRLELEYQNGSTQQVVTGIIKQPPILAPNLQSLGCHYFKPDSIGYAALKEAIPLLLNLRVVNISCEIGFDMVVQLSTLPDLSKLKIRVSSDRIPLTDRFSPGSFPVLEELQISGDPGHVVYAMNYITSSQLSDLRVDMFYEQKEATPFETFVYLTTITNFKFSWHNRYGPRQTYEIPRTLEPLYQCSILEHVHLHVTGRTPTITDQDVEVMAMSWPKLRSFAVYRGKGALWGGDLYLANDFDCQPMYACQALSTYSRDTVACGCLLYLYEGSASLNRMHPYCSIPNAVTQFAILSVSRTRQPACEVYSRHTSLSAVLRSERLAVRF
jgi:hypothetical protein